MLLNPDTEAFFFLFYFNYVFISRSCVWFPTESDCFCLFPFHPCLPLTISYVCPDLRSVLRTSKDPWIQSQPPAKGRLALVPLPLPPLHRIFLFSPLSLFLDSSHGLKKKPNAEPLFQHPGPSPPAVRTIRICRDFQIYYV